jgi:hypothetical protein
MGILSSRIRRHDARHQRAFIYQRIFAQGEQDAVDGRAHLRQNVPAIRGDDAPQQLTCVNADPVLDGGNE